MAHRLLNLGFKLYPALVRYYIITSSIAKRGQLVVGSAQVVGPEETKARDIISHILPR